MIRPALASDAVAIGRLWEQLVACHRELDEKMPRATADGALRYGRTLSDRLEDSHTRVFVAERDGRVVGYVLGVVRVWQGRTGRKGDADCTTHRHVCKGQRNKCIAIDVSTE